METRLDRPSIPGRERAAGKQGRVGRGASAAVQGSAVVVSHSFVEVPAQQRHAMIAEVAYHKARARGFEPGHKLDDWLLAEREIDAALAGGSCAAGRAGC